MVCLCKDERDIFIYHVENNLALYICNYLNCGSCTCRFEQNVQWNKWMWGEKSDATKYLPLQSSVLDNYCSNISMCNSLLYLQNGKKTLKANCCVFTVPSIFRVMVNEYVWNCSGLLCLLTGELVFNYWNISVRFDWLSVEWNSQTHHHLSFPNNDFSMPSGTPSKSSSPEPGQGWGLHPADTAPRSSVLAAPFLHRTACHQHVLPFTQLLAGTELSPAVMPSVKN